MAALVLISVSASFFGLEAVLAIYGSIGRRLKGDFGFPSAIRTPCRVHLPGTAAVIATPAIPLAIFVCSSATGASLWFVLKALFTIKGLFALCKEKFCPAVLANECFV
jgi:hypothetical protein